MKRTVKKRETQEIEKTRHFSVVHQKYYIHDEETNETHGQVTMMLRLPRKMLLKKKKKKRKRKMPIFFRI